MPMMQDQSLIEDQDFHPGEKDELWANPSKNITYQSFYALTKSALQKQKFVKPKQNMTRKKFEEMFEISVDDYNEKFNREKTIGYGQFIKRQQISVVAKFAKLMGIDMKNNLRHQKNLKSFINHIIPSLSSSMKTNVLQLLRDEAGFLELFYEGVSSSQFQAKKEQCALHFFILLKIREGFEKNQRPKSYRAQRFQKKLIQPRKEEQMFEYSIQQFVNRSFYTQQGQYINPHPSFNFGKWLYESTIRLDQQ